MIVYTFTAVGIFALSWVSLMLATIGIPYLYLRITERTQIVSDLLRILVDRKTIIKVAIVSAILAALVTQSSLNDGRENIPTFSHHCSK